MAFTEIVSDIAGVGPTSSFVLGPNTMAPYAGVQMLGLTDGTSPATASKNMAEIYNLQRFERKLAIEMAGLTYDPTDDSQFVRAMQLLPNLSPKRFATFPSVLAPVSAPSLADPATVKTNTNEEVFMYNGTRWVYVGGANYQTKTFGILPTGSSGALPAIVPANSVLATGTNLTVTNPSSTRQMLVTFSDLNLYLVYLDGGSTGGGDIQISVLNSGVPVFESYSQNYPSSSNVLAGIQVRVGGGGTSPSGSGVLIAAGSNAVFNLQAKLVGGQISTIPSAVAYISCTYVAENI